MYTSTGIEAIQMCTHYTVSKIIGTTEAEHCHIHFCYESPKSCFLKQAHTAQNLHVILTASFVVSCHMIDLVMAYISIHKHTFYWRGTNKLISFLFPAFVQLSFW